MKQRKVFKKWFDSICDFERTDVSVLDGVISVRDLYKQYDLSIDEILLIKLLTLSVLNN